MSDYNRPLEQILNYYQKYVKPAFEEFCLPTKKYADVIIPRGVENLVAINLIVQHINDYLTNSSNVNFNLNNNHNTSPIIVNENNSSKLFENDNSGSSNKTTTSMSHKLSSPSTSKPSSSNSLSSMNNNQLSVSVVGGQSQQMNSPGTPSKRSERPH
jgi:hypothetical protein